MTSLPDALRQADADLLGGPRDVWFAPVRHHSPGCARALRAMLRELRPAAVLVEAPADLQHLVPVLLDDATRPPVAYLVQDRRGDQMRSAFYPFSAHSPEWVALREGAALGAEVALVDLPWSQQHDAPADAEEGAGPGSLVEERYLAHSGYVSAMAATVGCVDHHDLWDRLFELRVVDPAQDWRGFFHDVFAWCAMARLDYEPQVLEAEGSLARERHMAARIRYWRDRVDGAVVVVTGGFHTLELVTSWQRTPAAAKDLRHDDAWLVRYGFAQLDALGGYASGMPAPAWYHRVWELTEDGHDEPSTTAAVETLTRAARLTREQGQVDAVSTASVEAAAAQVVRLAALRGNPGPGRQDVVDAARSCFVKGAVDEGTRGFLGDLRVLMAGSAVGDVPASAGSPPLVEDARRRAGRAGVRLDDSLTRTVRLDVYRKERHRERSRFLHAMEYLGTGVGQVVSGPDFVGGTRLELLVEEWVVGWSPVVEARLLELSAGAPDVETACLQRLQREEGDLSLHGRGRSAGTAADLLVRACLVGLHHHLPHLSALLGRHLDEDPSLASVLDCGRRLVGLWRAREPLGVQGDARLAALLRRVWPAALALLPAVGTARREDEPEAVRLLLRVRELTRSLGEVVETDGSADRDAALLGHLRRFADRRETAVGVAGAAVALLHLVGDLDEVGLSAQVVRRFGPGAPPGEAIRFLGGLMTAAPELVLRVPALLEGLDGLLRGWDAQEFVVNLPDLRLAFTGLTPQETSDLADDVLRLHGVTDAAPLDAVHRTTEDDLAWGTRLELALQDVLRRDGLVPPAPDD